MTLGWVIPGNISCPADAAEYGNYYSNSNAVDEFSSTTNFYVEILIAGATYSSGSGGVYTNGPATVPRPAAAGMCSSALILLGGTARRLRRSV